MGDVRHPKEVVFTVVRNVDIYTTGLLQSVVHSMDAFALKWAHRYRLLAYAAEEWQASTQHECAQR